MIEDEIPRTFHRRSPAHHPATGRAPGPVPRKAPSTEAHTLYLKGRQAWNQMTRAGFLAAIDLFDSAISLYPDYAPPYAGLAYAYMWSVHLGA